MNTILAITLLICLWHFIYEGIVAPSIRIKLRNRLFAIRDELRSMVIDGVSQDDQEPLHFVHDGVNNFIDRLPNLTLANTRRMELDYRSNPDLEKTVRAHFELIKSSKNEKIKSAFESTNDIIGIAIIANAGAWFVYLIPLACLAFTMRQMTKFVGQLVMTPSKEVDRFIPTNTSPEKLSFAP